VATIGVVCLLVGIGIGGAASSSTKSKPPAPTPAQLAAQAQATTARIHQEAVEKAANERTRVATEKKEAAEKASEARAAAGKAREEAAQKHNEEQKEKEEAAQKLANETKNYEGIGEKNLGTIVVPVSSTISWTCPGCKSGEGGNFIINNASSDSETIAVNGLDQTRGVSPMAAGTYHTVVVQTTNHEPWTVRIAPGE